MRIFNKRAKFDYRLEDEHFEAGIALTGGEAKAVRTGHLDLTSSLAKIVGSEVFLINAKIPVEGAKYQPTRTRKLLLHRQEITALATKAKQRKLTLVPLSLYTKGRLIKVRLALGKPKHQFEKRQTLKKRAIEEEIAKEFKRQ